MEQPLDGSAATTKPSGGNGNPVRPVQLDGCVHTAWNKSNLYLRDCADDVHDKLTGVPNANNKSELVFRVNRSVVVLNDTNGGNVWLVQQAMQLVNNWQDLQTPPNRSEEEKEDAADQNPLNQLPDRTKANRPPNAQDDVFGVRPGKTTLLTPLDNGSDPDADLLTLNVLGSGPGNGTAQPIYNGSALQISVPEKASGTSDFGYQVDDGRTEIEGKVTVEVRPRGSLPPVANPDHLSVVAGRDAVVSPLENDFDPAGATLRLARVEGPPAARVAPHFDSGTFVFNAPAAGAYYVTYQVTNGPASQLGLVRIDVTNGGTNGAPVAVRDVARLPQGGQSSWMRWPTTSTPPAACSSSNRSTFLPDRPCPWPSSTTA